MKNKNKKVEKKSIFSDSYKFLFDSKKYILFAIALFFFSFILGFLISPSPELLESIKKFIEELLKQTEGMSLIQLIWFIFLNNLKVAFFGMVFGVLFCFIPFLLIVTNGYFVGFVCLQSIMKDGIFSLWRLFPHGVFELPAIFISMGLGFRLGLFLFEKREKSFWQLFSKSIILFFLIVLPLLFVAAIIEASFIFYS